MCLGLPGRVVSVELGGQASQVEIAGVVRRIDTSLLPAGLRPGDHVLVHSGIALERMSADRAREAESLFAPPGPLRKDVAEDQRLPR